MRIFALLFTILFPALLQAQNLTEAYRGSLKYNYYKLSQQQAERLYQYGSSIPIDSFLTNLVLEVPNDSFGKVLPKEPGHYVYTHVTGNLLHYNSYSKPFIRVNAQGVLGEGRLKLYDFAGTAVKDAVIKIKVKKKKWEQVNFDEGCGCFSFKEKAYGQLISIRHGNEFDFYKVTNEGLVIPSIDRSNPYAGQKVFLGYMVFNKPKYRHFDTLKMKAFVVTNDGWPLRRKLDVFLTANYKETKIASIKPVSNGAYVFDFVVSDSLRLNSTITVTLKNKGTFIKSNTVTIEDYELKKATYASRMLKSQFNKGEKVELVVDAFDANSMPMLDTRVKVKTSLESALGLIPEEYKTHDSVLQNLFSYNEIIDESGTSIIEIPESSLLPIQGNYILTVDQINSEGEFKTQVHRFYHNAKASYNKFAQIGNQLLGKTYLNGDEQKGEAVKISEYLNGFLLSETVTAFPIKYTINPSANKIAVTQNDSVLYNQYIQDQSAQFINVTGNRSHNVVSVNLENPWGLDVYYRVYRNKEVVTKGFGDSLNYKAEDNSMWPYYVLWGYQWAGKEHFYETPLTVKEKELKVTVNQPKAIFPGENVDFSITVTDYKDKPLKSVNLTAYSINTEFANIPLPEMPYFGRRFPNMSSSSRFYTNQVSYSGSKNLTYNLFNLINVLDTNYYLNYLFPNTKMQEYVQENDYELPEFVPTILHEGVAQNIVNVWFNDHLVFSKVNSNSIYQNIRYPAGKYKVRIRTTNKTFEIDEISLKQYAKHFISIDDEKCNEKGVVINKLEDFIIDDNEYRDINKQTFWIDNQYFTTDTVWVENAGLKWLLYANGRNEHKRYWYKEVQKYLLSISGLREGPTVLRINSDTLYFNFEPGKYYVYEKGILTSFQMPYLPINRNVAIITSAKVSYNLDNKPLYFNNETKKVAKRKKALEAEKEQKKPWFQKIRNYSYAKRHKTKNASFKIFNPAGIVLQNYWLINKEQPSYSYAVSGSLGSHVATLKSGKYTAVFITTKGKVCIKKDIDLNTNDYYFIRLNSSRFEIGEAADVEPYREIIHRISRPEIRAASLYPDLLKPEWRFRSDTSQFGSILGVLKDKVSWTELSGATILLEQDGYIKNAVVSNYWGEFIFRNVPEGQYMLKIMHDGFRFTTIDKLLVNNTKTTLLNFNLERRADYFNKISEPIQPAEKYIVEAMNYGMGQINVKVVDAQTGEALLGANLLVYDGDNLLKGVATNIKGEASLNNLPNDILQLRISYIGYAPLKLNLDLKQRTEYTIKAPLITDQTALSEVLISDNFAAYSPDAYGNSVDYEESYVSLESVKSREIARLPIRGSVDVIATAGGATSVDGSAPIIRGGRSEQAITYVDGVPVRGSSAMPQSAYGEFAFGDLALGSKLGTLDNGNILKDALDLLGGKTPPNRLRTNFKDYGFWVPNLITDAEGKSYFTAKMPDNITQWQTIVPAMDHRRNTGIATENMKAYLPYTAQLGLPRFLVKGDIVNITGKVFNYTEDSLKVNATFSVDDKILLQKEEDIKRQVSLNTSLVADKADSLNISFVISNSYGFKEGEKRPLKVYEDYIEKARVAVVKVASDTSFTISQELDENFGIIVFNDKRDYLLEQINILKSYGYGCVEQTASKLFALLAEKQLCQVMGKSFNDEKMLKRMMARLAKLQKVNGSYGWWQNDKTNDWISIYVAKVLSKAQALGYNSFAFTRVMNYVKRNQSKFNNSLYQESIILLMENGLKVDLERFEKLNYESLASIDKLNNLRILQLQGQKDLSFKVMSLVKKDNCGLLYWGNSSSIFYRDKSFASMVALKILSNEGAKPKVVKAIENGLFEVSCRSYSSMNTLQRALLIGYLLDNMDTETKGEVNKGFLINGQKVIDFPKRFNSNNDPIELSYQGSTNAMVMIVRNDKVRNASPDSEQFTVSTQLYQDNKQVEKLALGKSVELKVSVKNRLSADFVMIEIPIPAGCSYGTTALPKFRHEVYREYRRNKVVIYCTELLAGEHTFSIALEPRFSGSFTLLPTTVEQMYFPEISGNNALKKVVVE